MAGFSEVSSTPVERLEVPTASYVLILSCAEPVTLRPARGRGSSFRLPAFVAGLQVPAQRVLHSGVNDCIEVRLSPIAAHALLGPAVADSCCDPIDLCDLTRERTRGLLDQLRAMTAWPERLAAVDQFLKDGLAGAVHRVPKELAWAWQALERCHGQLSVRGLAHKIDSSERHLIRQFYRYFGVSPKTAARRLRFSYAFNLMTSDTRSDLAAVAAQSGFSDQSHMSREFRELSGSTPHVVRSARFDSLPGIPASALLAP